MTDEMKSTPAAVGIEPGIRGWLLVYVIIQAFIALMGFAGIFVSVSAGGTIQCAAAFLMYGFLAAIVLRKRRFAVKVVIAFSLIALFLSVLLFIMSAVFAVLGLINGSDKMLTLLVSVALCATGMAYNYGWFRYFRKSKRVEVTLVR